MASGTTIQRPVRRGVARPALLRGLVQAVRQRHLFAKGQHLLVAVSGGPDSMALLSLLDRLRLSWSLTLTVVHFNYGLRGAESDEDEAFVRTCCVERHLPLVVQRPRLHSRQKTSLQARARDIRYAAMAKLADELKADRIVLGHTANDQAETMLMWMMRGAGLAGLVGIPYVRDQKIVRPLLASTREEVLAYLGEEALSYRRDSSNDSMKYRRNRIRHELIPAMTRMVPAAVRILQRQADLLHDDDEYLERVSQGCVEQLVTVDTEGRQSLDRPGFAALPVAIQRRVLRNLLRRSDERGRASHFQIIESVRRFLLKGKPEVGLTLKHAHILLERTMASIRLHPSHVERQIVSMGREDESLALSVPSSVHWRQTNQQVHAQLMSRQEAERTIGALSKWRGVFDADRLGEPLMVRAWRAGDRFCPQGMKGRSKKLQDFFTDLKVGRRERSHVPLLVGPNGIAWVMGYRQDGRYAMSEQTTCCVVVSVSEPEKREGAR